MNPQVAFWFQQLIQMGYTPQQAMQYAPMMVQATGGTQPGGTSPGTSGSNPLQDNLAAILGTQAGISGFQLPYNLEKQAATTSMNPALMNQRINQFTRPLSQNLIHSVTRAVAPSIAERGLATAPGMSEQITAEALAPYELQEQQQGENLAQSTFEPAFQFAGGAGAQMAGQQEDLAHLIGLLGSSY